MEETIESVIFNRDVVNYITIVRTNFADFRNKNKCWQETQALINRNDAIGSIAGRCSDIIFVDNLSIDLIDLEISDEEQRQEIEDEI